MSDIILFNALTNETINENVSVATVGGKGYSLIQMTKYKFNVPPGIVLTVSFFKQWLEELKTSQEYKIFLSNTKNPEECKNNLDNLKQWCLSNLTLKEEQKKQIENYLSQINKNYKSNIYAVRSSSPEEDLSGASFAGGYETYLGIIFSDLEKNILKTFISCLDYRVYKYKLEKNFNEPENMKIAIVIMKQINSDCAGVGFSINPLNNDMDECVINSNFGLGETVVQGIITPDQFIVNKINLKIKDKKVGKKDKIISIDNENIGQLKNIINENNSFSLSDEQLITITKNIKSLEEYYKCPIDIEFAFENNIFYLLQARPITTFNSLPKILLTDRNEKRKLYFDVTYVVQGFEKPLSILGSEIIKSIFNGLGRYIPNSNNFVDIKDSIVGLVGGKILLNLSGLMALIDKSKVINFLSNINETASKMLKEEGDKYVADNIPNEVNVWKIGLIWRLPVLRIFFYNFFAQYNELKLNEGWIEYCQKLDELTKKCIQGNIKLSEMMFEIGNYIGEFFRDKLIPVGASMGRGMMGMKNLFEPYIKENDFIRQEYLNATKCMKTITNIMCIKIYRLSKLIPDRYKTKTFEEFFNDYKKIKPFYNKFMDFMKIFGCRGEGELDTCNSRFSENHEIILKQIFAHLSVNYDDKNLSPEKFFEVADKERPKHYNNLLKFAQEKGFENEFKESYNFYVNFFKYRESPKYYIIFTIGEVRKVIQKLLQKKNIQNDCFGQNNSIWDLNINHFDELIFEKNITPEKINEFIKDDTKERNIFLTWNRMPQIFDSRGLFLTLNKKKSNENEKGILYGDSVSYGKYKGIARIMKTSTEKEFKPGEILITSATDPGWTPLIVSSGAIVLEIGGMLQHGALVAREFGKPCVVGVEKVMEKIKDGDEIEVDAIEGKVIIINQVENN